MVVNGCRIPPTENRSSNVIADSVSGFSGEQGGNSWYYGYWDRTNEPNQSYAQKSDFQLLKHFGVDPKNQLSGHSDFTTGELWNLDDGVYYTSLWAEGGHPNSAMELGEYEQIEQWAVRRWVSTVDGHVTISGHVGKVMPWGESWSGNCKAMVVVDGKTVYTGVIDNQGTDYSIETDVQIDSMVDFLIGPDPAIGVTTFTATIRTTEKLDE